MTIADMNIICTDIPRALRAGIVYRGGRFGPTVKVVGYGDDDKPLGQFEWFIPPTDLAIDESGDLIIRGGR